MSKDDLLSFCERKMQTVAKSFVFRSRLSPYLVVKLREGVTGEAAPPSFVVNKTEVLLDLLICSSWNYQVLCQMSIMLMSWLLVSPLVSCVFSNSVKVIRGPLPVIVEMGKCC